VRADEVAGGATRRLRARVANGLVEKSSVADAMVIKGRPNDRARAGVCHPAGVGGAFSVSTIPAMTTKGRVFRRATFVPACERWCSALRMATVVALSPACSPPMSYVLNAKKAAVDACIHKSCIGPSGIQASDYDACVATCRERHGSVK